MTIGDLFIYKYASEIYHAYVNIICKARYNRIQKRLIKKVRSNGRINVCFLVNEISKWKAQSIYELLDKDCHFEPFIGLTFADLDWNLTSQERSIKRQSLALYFKEKNMCVREICTETEPDQFDIYRLDADIVFYQQPWNIHPSLRPEKLSKHALLCYFPYYVPNYSLITNDCKQEFHYKLWKYFQLCNGWVDALKEATASKVKAVDIIATGHPMLDCINNTKVNKPNKKIVIYSPHWSVYSDVFNNEERYSTFQHNGKEILEYAKQHTEIDWYFKPHPTLKTSLLRTKLMTQDEIEEYYSEWKKLGNVVEGGDYIDLFWKSSAMITDCGSFLVEYPCTGKPLLHLISSACRVSVPKPSKELFDSFYKIHNLEEMYKCFDMVLCNGEDPLYETRMESVRKAGINETHASENIVNHLRVCLSISNYG